MPPMPAPLSRMPRDCAPLSPASLEPPLLRDRHRRAAGAYRCIHQPIGGGAKRLLDVVLAGVALALLSPLLALLALLVKLESRGPVFFRQRRAGFRGRVFRIYKFRTMRAQEDGRDFRQAVPDDERITRIGRFLRKTSLDELPQLLNVLTGEMSLVGPRPHALLHEQVLRRRSTDWALRRMARPGITGLAQVSGARGLTDSEEKMHRRLEFDLQYIRTWSLWQDLQILLRTVRLILRDPMAF